MHCRSSICTIFKCLCCVAIAFHHVVFCKVADVSLEPSCHHDEDSSCQDWGSINRKAASEDPHLFCVVIRTYWGHGDQHGGGLRRLIRSLQRQTHERWEAIILVADSQPFKDLHNILSDIGDDRTWVFAEWIGQSFAPKANGEWLPNYHSMLYNLTDDAMTVCPPDTKWVVVTNGDNEYARGFMERVLKESRDTSAFERPVVSTEAPIDIVAFDFYSRYLRPTAPPCERFGVRQSNFSPCKPNLLRWCQVDLGAVALSWHRWQREGRSFGAIDGSDRGLGAEHNDGLAMEELMKDGWKSRRVQDACLFVHAPSPQSCAWHGGVWDDRDIIETGGGTCISVEEAANILNHEGQDVEEVRISIANDRHIDAFEGATQELLIPGRCLRRKEYASPHVWGRNMVWFSELCTDPEDMDTFAKQMKLFYPTDEDLEAALLPQSPSVPQPT